MKVYFFLPQIAQFHKSINLFRLVFLTLVFSFPYFSQLLQYVSLVTYNLAIFFLTIIFIAFYFIISSGLNSNPNNLIEICVLEFL